MTGLASDAARAFIRANPPDTESRVTPETVEQFRQEARDEFLSRSERAVARYDVSVRDISLDGVPCLDIRPHNAGAPEHDTHAILYCFGGGYVTGSARQDLIVSAALAAHTGVPVIAVDYRLAPEHPWPAASDDGFRVYNGLVERGTQFAIVGESAGGNLALALMQRAGDRGLRLPLAAVLLSPWCDLANEGDSLTANDGRDPTLSKAYVDSAAELYAGGQPLRHSGISPLYGTFGRSFPSTLITSGTRDLLLSQCVRLSQVMHAAGCDVTLRIWDDLWHVFEFYDEIPEAAQSLAEAGIFLSAQFAKVEV